MKLVFFSAAIALASASSLGTNSIGNEWIVSIPAGASEADRLSHMDSVRSLGVEIIAEWDIGTWRGYAVSSGDPTLVDQIGAMDFVNYTEKNQIYKGIPVPTHTYKR